jgi:hypothetical protein
VSAFAVHNIAFSIVLWTWPNFSLSAPLNGLCKGIATPQATPRAPPAPVWEGEALAQQTSRPEVEDAAWAKSTQLSVSGFPPNVSWTQVWLGQKNSSLCHWGQQRCQVGLTRGRSLGSDAACAASFLFLCRRGPVRGAMTQVWHVKNSMDAVLAKLAGNPECTPARRSFGCRPAARKWRTHPTGQTQVWHLL